MQTVWLNKGIIMGDILVLNRKIGKLISKAKEIMAIIESEIENNKYMEKIDYIYKKENKYEIRFSLSIVNLFCQIRLYSNIAFVEYGVFADNYVKCEKLVLLTDRYDEDGYWINYYDEKQGVRESVSTKSIKELFGKSMVVIFTELDDMFKTNTLTGVRIPLTTQNIRTIEKSVRPH